MGFVVQMIENSVQFIKAAVVKNQFTFAFGGVLNSDWHAHLFRQPLFKLLDIGVYLASSEFQLSIHKQGKHDHHHDLPEIYTTCPILEDWAHFVKCVTITDEGKTLAYVVVEFSQDSILSRLITQLGIFIVCLLFHFIIKY